jgi:hypothetical protein
MDQTFLWLERRNQAMHVGGLQLITPPPDAPPDFVQRIADLHPGASQPRGCGEELAGVSKRS